MQSRGVPWALACAFGDGTRRRCGENGTAEDPGTVRQRVECLDLTSFRRNPECSRRHSKKPRGIVEVKPRFDSVVSRLMDGDAVMGAQRGDTLARPAIAIAGHQPIPVQDAGDEIVVGDQHQLAYGGNHIGRGAGALPAPPPGQAYLVWTPPTQWMNRTISAASVSISAITSWITVRTMRFFNRASVVGSVSGNLGFDLRHAGERRVPSRLQFASHQSVGRVGSVVLPEGPIGCIARRFEITPERLTHLVPLLPRLLLGSNGCRNSARANDCEKGTLMASSTRSPPKAMHRGSPLSIQPRVQL